MKRSILALAFLCLNFPCWTAQEKLDLIVKLDNGKEIAYKKENISNRKLSKKTFSVFVFNGLHIKSERPTYFSMSNNRISLKNMQEKDYVVTFNEFIVNGEIHREADYFFVIWVKNLWEQVSSFAKWLYKSICFWKH